MNQTQTVDDAFNPLTLAIAAVAVAVGAAGYLLIPEYGNAVYYALMTIGVLALGGLLVKNRR
jgi:cell division protein FtsW (lipid II flippase)